MKKFIAVLAAVALVGLVARAEDAKEVELSGKMGCAHCNFKQKGEECGAAFKTADGKVYIIQDASKECMDARTKGVEVKVKGVVTEKDGKNFVKASSTEIQK